MINIPTEFHCRGETAGLEGDKYHKYIKLQMVTHAHAHMDHKHAFTGTVLACLPQNQILP